jgi:DNA-binding Lrp family transcriptional regulator
MPDSINENSIFKGVWIPKEIWLSNKLDLVEKHLLTEIDRFTNSDKDCFKSNKTFSEFLGVSESKISTAITNLKNLGLIEQIHFDGRERHLRSLLSFSPQILEALQDKPKEDCKIPPCKINKADLAKSHSNNIYNIQSSIIPKVISSNSKFIKPTIQDIKIYCQQRKNSVDAEYFHNHYESKGWKIGNSPMQDWKATIRNWELRDKKDAEEKINNRPGLHPKKRILTAAQTTIVTDKVF